MFRGRSSSAKSPLFYFGFLRSFFLSGLRFVYRYFRYTRTRNKARIRDAAPALLLGLAADVEIALRAIESGAIKQFWPVGILSPSAADRGQLVRNTPVLGSVDDLKEVVSDFAYRDKAIKRLVLTASAFNAEAKPESVIIQARQLGLIVSQLPSLQDGYAPQLRPVAVEDLLLRPSEKIDYARLDAFVRNKAVIVTGGGGSIGSEICDRVVTFGAARLLVIENSEPALYAILESLTTRTGEASVEGRIADVRDRARISQLMNEFRPDIVFHAAALKHVPILERDWTEGVKTNIFGSINVADAAVAAGAEAMVMISTDKAIEPVSMLGLTKRFAEMYCQALDEQLAEKASAWRPCASDFGAVRQCARIKGFGGSEVQGADRGGGTRHSYPSGHGPLLHDHPRGLRSRHYRSNSRVIRNRPECIGVRAQHGAAGQDRRSGRTHDRTVRLAG